MKQYSLSELCSWIQDVVETDLPDRYWVRAEIASMSVEPGEILKTEITGISTESTVPGEGKITYDIRFVVYKPGEQQKIKLIINIFVENYFLVYIYDTGICNSI